MRASPRTIRSRAFLGFALLDQDGVSTNYFRQGDWLRLIFEVGDRQRPGEHHVPASLFATIAALFLHGKYEFQLDPMKLRTCKKGDVFRVSYAVRLDITAGFYTAIARDVIDPARGDTEREIEFCGL